MKKSFTLIELLVVVLIIATMSAIGAVIFNKGRYTMKQNDTTRKKDLNQLAAALEEFKADHGHYPFVNWYNGKHAYEAVGGFTDAQCLDGIVNAAYLPSLQTTTSFVPGTDLGHACDDVSLQLLGRAYLTKMPIPTQNVDGSYNDLSVQDVGNWLTSGDQVKKYLDVIPSDPNFWQTVSSTSNPPTADYTASAAFRYWYNSYYNCVAQAINTGDRYWMNAIMQLKDDGVAGANNSNIYYYEVGTMNFENDPPNVCG